MSRQVMEVLFLYQVIKYKLSILYLVNNNVNITDKIYDEVFNNACKDVASSLKITEGSVRDKFSRKANIDTQTAKQTIKDYLFHNSMSFEDLISKLVTKKDNYKKILSVLRSM